jgi:hypothetical protein
LVPVLEMAEKTGLSESTDEHVDLPSVRCGEPSQEGDLDHRRDDVRAASTTSTRLRAAGTPRVFDEVYAPFTLAVLLREFTLGHAMAAEVVPCARDANDYPPTRSGEMPSG